MRGPHSPFLLDTWTLLMPLFSTFMLTRPPLQSLFSNASHFFFLFLFYNKKVMVTRSFERKKIIINNIHTELTRSNYLLIVVYIYLCLVILSEWRVVVKNVHVSWTNKILPPTRLQHDKIFPPHRISFSVKLQKQFFFHF